MSESNDKGVLAPPDRFGRQMVSQLRNDHGLEAPPKRAEGIAHAKAQEHHKESWGAWSKRKAWSTGEKVAPKFIAVSDKVGTKLNNTAGQYLGVERFWPTSGDFKLEMEKCARIVRSFTVDGVEKKVKVKDSYGNKVTKTVTKKIPPEVMRDAMGVAVFTSMRSGMFPFGGAGGAGAIVARLPDGSWSPPSLISPQNATVGFMFGVDVYDAILVIRTQAAINAFMQHKVSLGTEIGVAAGPYGTGALIEMGLDKAPVLSYFRSKGVYGGAEAMIQAYLHRFDENERQYWWPGITAKDIMTGRVEMPLEAKDFITALKEAETGAAQAKKVDSASLEHQNMLQNLSQQVSLTDGEVLRLPPTPDQIDAQDAQERVEAFRRAHEEKLNELRSASHTPSTTSTPDRTHSPINVAISSPLTHEIHSPLEKEAHSPLADEAQSPIAITTELGAVPDAPHSTTTSNSDPPTPITGPAPIPSDEKRLSSASSDKSDHFLETLNDQLEAIDLSNKEDKN